MEDWEKKKKKKTQKKECERGNCLQLSDFTSSIFCDILENFCQIDECVKVWQSFLGRVDSGWVQKRVGGAKRRNAPTFCEALAFAENLHVVFGHFVWKSPSYFSCRSCRSSQISKRRSGCLRVGERFWWGCQDEEKHSLWWCVNYLWFYRKFRSYNVSPRASRKSRYFRPRHFQQLPCLLQGSERNA